MEYADEDISLQPGINSDSKEEIEKHISQSVLKKYEIFSYRHASSILKNSFPVELAEIEKALLQFSISTDDIAKPGGNESDIPKKISETLRPSNWFETRIQGDLIVRVERHDEIKVDGKLRKTTLDSSDPITISNYIDGHKIDYVKGKVALDLEWNSKDQTFDRDLYAFRMFHECGVISVAVLVTRSERLNKVFAVLPKLDKDGNVVKKNGEVVTCKDKYGASTTWMGKLIYRLNAGRHGGCPVLVVGITEKAIKDLKEVLGDSWK